MSDIKINKKTGKKYRLVLQECESKHCCNTDDLKKGIGRNRWYVPDSQEPLHSKYFIDKWFCPECYEEETQVQCYYCEETLQNGNDVVLNSENESCCVACYVAVSCCPNKHYGGQYGCDFCPPVKCDWGCNDCRGKSDKGFCYKYEKKDTYELTSFVRENRTG